MIEAVQITLPARINLLGNPTDAVEGDFAVISAAINLYAHAELIPGPETVLQHFSGDPQAGGRLVAESRPESGPALQPRSTLARLALQTAALHRLAGFTAELRAKAAGQGATIRTWTEVPRGSGLGGSSLLVLLVLAGLRAFYRLDPQQHHDYLLAELAQRVESQDLGITCGYADRYVPLFGGLLYIDYRGKLQQQPLGQEPLATVERLEAYVPRLPLVLAASGVAHDSGNIHQRLRAQYLTEQQERGDRAAPGPLETILKQVYASTWQGKYDLLRGDLAAFGGRLQSNHAAIDALMRRCGFEAGAGAANNVLIEQAYALGALGAKLTGAGGGGSVFALVEPGTERQFAARWLDAARQAGLDQARLYTPEICRTGLQVAAVSGE
jgi:galactokinase/mevalonate kinase-like predicted kinase